MSGNERDTEILGLVLVGGHSRRMGRDKAMLVYNGQRQVQRAFQLLKGSLQNVFVSLRTEQREAPDYSDFSVIADDPQYADRGPASGILSALIQYPNNCWLVLACDLPLVTSTTIHNLIKNRDAMKLATAYRNEEQGFPEPLCTIYEPQSLPVFKAAFEAGTYCPRKILSNNSPHYLDVPESGVLNNINTQQEYDAAQVLLNQIKEK